MVKQKTKVKCPSCNELIILDEVLTASIEQDIRKNLQKDYDSKLSIEIKKVSEKEKKIARSEIDQELKDRDNTISEQKRRIRETEEKELMLRKEKRELEEKREKFELEIQRKIDEEKKKIREDVSKKKDEEFHLKLKEKDVLAETLKKEISELKRKAEQGSQQTQGEILEIELFSTLKENFVNDEFEEIKKGVSGADILQKVKSSSGKICGSILIEAKNTKNWGTDWIPKLKSDQRESKADIAILVSSVLPKGASSFDFRDGITAIRYTDVIPVVALLRTQLIEITRIKSLSMSKDEKMEALHNYLTGPEFKQKVEAMAEALKELNTDLVREKTSMQKIWSKREKQIQKTISSLTGLYGGMQGILGSSLSDVKELEFKEED